MATVNNVVVPNFPPSTLGGTDSFTFIWKLTRALKKAGWKYIASSNGVSKDTSGNPANDYWNTTFGTVGVLTSSGSGAAINAAVNGRALVTGLTLTSGDKGRFLVFPSVSATDAYQIEEVNTGTGEAKIDARAVAVVANPGPLNWEIRDVCDPLETYPSGLTSVSAWWCARGPSILRIPITAAPVAGLTSYMTFLRGENVVQATTGAEGEIRGWVFNSTTNTGYLVVHPRVRGSGTGPYGWDTGNVVTGSLTGSTVTQVGTNIEYRAEVVYWKANNLSTGSAFYGWFDPTVDRTFSDSNHLTGSTATVAPGGATGANDFPVYALVGVGTSTTGGHQRWVANSLGYGNAQIMVADCIEEEKYTADGSLTCAVTLIASGVPYTGFCFQVLDDGEDGDLYPYIIGHAAASGTGNYPSVNQRTGLGTATIDVNGRVFSCESQNLGWRNGTNNGPYQTFWRGWYNRGLAGDVQLVYEMIVDGCGQSNASNANALTLNSTPGTPERLQTTPGFVKLRRPIPLAAINRKQRKGTVRYWWTVQGGASNDTYDNKKYVQLDYSTDWGAGVVGPWDGVTMPVGY